MDRKMWKKQRKQVAELSKAEKEAVRRARLISTPELVPWIEQCLFTEGRALSEYTKDPTKHEYLEEAEKANLISRRLILELSDRAKNRTFQQAR